MALGAVLFLLWSGSYAVVSEVVCEVAVLYMYLVSALQKGEMEETEVASIKNMEAVEMIAALLQVSQPGGDNLAVAWFSNCSP